MSKYTLNQFTMHYFLKFIDLLHFLLGLVIVILIIFGLIKTHNYFSKDNVFISKLT